MTIKLRNTFSSQWISFAPKNETGFLYLNHPQLEYFYGKTSGKYVVSCIFTHVLMQFLQISTRCTLNTMKFYKHLFLIFWNFSKIRIKFCQNYPKNSSDDSQFSGNLPVFPKSFRIFLLKYSYSCNFSKVCIKFPEYSRNFLIFISKFCRTFPIFSRNFHKIYFKFLLKFLLTQEKWFRSP